MSGPANFESHLFGRGWLSSERTHRLNWAGAIGFRVWKLKVGPSGGVHMQVDPDGFEFKSDGNSWRVGGKASGYFAVSKATVSINARYEYTTAYSSQITIDRNTGLVSRGELETRHPTTLQIAGSVRVPVTRDLDAKVDVRQYDIRLDLDNTVSIGPVDNRSQTHILAGLVYRISR
ncbi:MAG: hypothetical protein HKN13_06225 [Rhodothermales bacterium]|nr:hypothetical protein [Rhodothermales bacterium]